VKIRSVRVNARRKGFDVTVGRRTLPFPFAKADPVPDAADPVVHAYVDPEIAREGFVYVLASGREGTVHVEQVLDYNRDPDYLRGILLHRLTVEAARRLEASGLAKREVIRRLGTSPAQLYRLLDPTDRRKSVDAMLALLQVLDCDVDVVVDGRTL
jgi:hypothetical protein